jgi:glycosyltransferase involved in cell wall biosynthesis
MKPRLAWVAPYLPEPRTSGGVLRIQELAAHLSHEYELHLFCRGELWERRRLASDELGMFHSRWLGRDLWQGTVSDLPSKTRRGSPRSLYREIKRRHQRTPFQALVLEHCWSAWGAFDLGIPTLLDEHNIESAYLADWYAARAQQRRGWQHQVAAMRRWEQRAWCSATDVACVSVADAEHIAGFRKAPPTVVANGTQTHSIKWSGAAARDAGILFLGALHHPPNAHAAWRLATEIMPLVWQTRPTATLDIVGPAPSAALQALACERLRVHGKVPDVRPFLERCAAFAFPLSQGAGSSLKTIEALAAGAPLVSSKLGARGFGLEPGEHYLQAASNNEFADTLCAVLADPFRFETMTRAGRARAELYDWSVQADTFGSRVALMIR